MIIVNIVLGVVSLGFFCWLLFTLAVYALPFFAGVTAAFATYHSGSGVIGAIIVGVLAGGATLAIGQIAFARVRTPLFRVVIGLLYAVPATIAGYHATLGLAHIGVLSEDWREAFAVVGAVLVGGTAWARMTLFIPPNAVGASQEVRRRFPWRERPERGEPAPPRRSVGYRSDDRPSG